MKNVSMQTRCFYFSTDSTLKVFFSWELSKKSSHMHKKYGDTGLTDTWIPTWSFYLENPDLSEVKHVIIQASLI